MGRSNNKGIRCTESVDSGGEVTSNCKYQVNTKNRIYNAGVSDCLLTVINSPLRVNRDLVVMLMKAVLNGNMNLCGRIHVTSTSAILNVKPGGMSSNKFIRTPGIKHHATMHTEYHEPNGISCYCRR